MRDTSNRSALDYTLSDGTGVFDSIAAGVWVVDPQYRTTYANASMAHMLGHSPGDMQGLPLLGFVPEESRVGAQAYLERFRQGGDGQADLPLRSKDGSLRWALVSTHRLPSAVLEQAGLVCVMVDITERKRTEDALRQSEAHYRVLAETAEDHIFVINREDRVDYVNQAAARQLRTVPEQVIGRRRSEIFPPDVAERQGGGLQHVFNTGKPLYVEGRTLYLEREVWLGTWLAPVTDANGQVTAVLGVSRDMTERKQLEAELTNAQKLEAIGRLAGGIAHDFNNNLTAILGYVEMMLGASEANSQMARDLGEVQFAAERAAGLVRRLLAFGRRQVIQPRNIALNEVIERLKPMLDRLIGEHIRIAVALAPDPWSVTGDAGEFEQVIMNLALNARDAMPKGGTLRIETTNATVSEKSRRPTMPAGPHVLLTIRDTGIGMDVHTRAHVFEPFFTTKPAGQGTGLGLSTVYGIVKQLNGFIWVESEVGQGSAFHVYLPAAEGGAAPEPAAPVAVPKPSVGRRETVLLVEDEETVRRFAKAALELHGFRVLAAATPEEALALASAHEHPISLLLTDVVMPQMGGPELADRLKKARPDMAVLFMSGYPSTLVLKGGLLDPSMRLISKPFSTSDLLTSIDDVLGTS